MTPEQQRVAIAEACGWTRSEQHDYDAWADYPATQDCRQRFWTNEGRLREQRKLPDYVNDLNAMHDAVQRLRQQVNQFQWLHYQKNLFRVVWGRDALSDDRTSNAITWDVIEATAPQRSEAFLRTIGKWKSEP